MAILLVYIQYRKERYQVALEKMENKTPNYNRVRYDARYNRDKLDKMIISHVTVLEYAEKLIVDKEFFMQVVCDRFPFVLVYHIADGRKDYPSLLKGLA